MQTQLYIIVVCAVITILIWVVGAMANSRMNKMSKVVPPNYPPAASPEQLVRAMLKASGCHYGYKIIEWERRYFAKKIEGSYDEIGCRFVFDVRDMLLYRDVFVITELDARVLGDPLINVSFNIFVNRYLVLKNMRSGPVLPNIIFQGTKQNEIIIKTGLWVGSGYDVQVYMKGWYCFKAIKTHL